jgi:hypothetical protein
VSHFFNICFNTPDESHIWSEIYFRKLLGRTDIEGALKRVNSVIQNEVPMAIAQTMKVTSDVKDGARPVPPAIHFIYAEPLSAQMSRK